MANKIEKELLAVTGQAKRGDDEMEQDYFRRLYDKANKMSDTDWGKCSDATQLWVNAAGDAVDDDNSIPNFDGEASETKPADEAGEAESEAETAKAGKDKAKPKAKEQMAKEKVVVEKTAKKANGKEKAASKKNGDATSKAGRKGTYPLDATITVNAKENPHRKTSKDFDKFKKLKSGMTVEKAVAAGVDWGYLRYGVNREILAVK